MFPIDFQPLGHVIVLAKVGGAHVVLHLDEQICPFHVMYDVADPHRLCGGRAVGVYFLLLSVVDDGSFYELCCATRVALEVGMHHKGRIKTLRRRVANFRTIPSGVGGKIP